jgi:hypothetical protein
MISYDVSIATNGVYMMCIKYVRNGEAVSFRLPVPLYHLRRYFTDFDVV